MTKQSSETLALIVNVELYSLGLDTVVLPHSGNHEDMIWISWVNREGRSRRQEINGPQFLSWLRNTAPNKAFCLLTLERRYNTLRKQQSNQKP